MKKFRELIEASDTIVFGFGRFNPPTTGHEKLIKKIASVAGSNPYRIYPSHTTNPKRDPLPHALKVAYMRSMFRKYAKKIIADKDARTAHEIVVKLYNEGFKNLIMVVGSDRVAEFDALLSDYNGVEGKRHGYYKFDSIDIVSAGERDPDAEGVSGMSASKMRAAAVDGDFKSFSQGLPSGFKDAKKIYRDVRKYMGIREERDMGDMTDFETIRDAYLTGKLWNVGDIVETKENKGEVVRKGTNYLSFADEDGKVHKVWLHEITLNEFIGPSKSDVQKYYDRLVRKGKSQPVKATEKAFGLKNLKIKKGEVLGYVVKERGEGVDLDERNYASEYANYHSKPEQIARRSSRNKARRVMGDKTKMGMDVGHRDNNPMNNDPKNLRNEDPSKNRREPRLRENEDLDEMSWYKELIAKISQINHPTGYEKLAKEYAAKMREKEYKGRQGAAIANVAKMTRNITPRQLAAYINKLVDQGVFPQDLHTEYVPEGKLPPHLAKFVDKKGNLKPDAAKRVQKARSKSKIKDVTPKGYGPNEAKSPLQKLKDFDKTRTDLGKKPIFKDKKSKKENNISSFREFVELINKKPK